MFILDMIENPVFGICWITTIMFSICLHEYAHAITALKCGDDTAASQGHLSLNPAIQMGGMSILFLFLIGIAWGAVPVNESRMRHRLHPALVAFAGPLSNLILCALFALAWTAIHTMAPQLDHAKYFLGIGSLVNGTLFCLNMLPIPPLDGWTVLAGFVPRMKHLSPQVLQNISFLLIALMLFGALRFVSKGGEVISGFFYTVFGYVARLFLQ
jgi:Zn-dependent protease